MISLDLMKSSEVRIAGDQPNNVPFFGKKVHLVLRLRVFYFLRKTKARIE